MLCLRKGGSQDNNGTHGCVSCSDERGFAVIVALIALSIFSVLGMYMSVNATTEVRISNNYESRLQASFAARAGIDHVRNLLASDPIQFQDLLNGPDGTHSATTSYLTQARTSSFRNPLTWQTARSLSILDPASAVAGLPDDGIVNTGKYAAANGTPLIPIDGIALSSPNPYGSGTIITSRYFVKVTDNTGEVTERTAAGTVPGQQDDPFVDSDGTIIIRSMGVAGTMRETGGGTVRANSISVYEMRFRRSRSFVFDSPLVLEGDTILPSAPGMWNGAAFKIDGGSSWGVATIDPNLANGTSVSQVNNSELTTAQKKNITGRGGVPSIGDITTDLTGDGLNLLNPGYLWNFIQYDVPSFADGVYQGDQSWSGNSQPYVGFFDPTKELTDPVQDPKVTYVNGDLTLGGGFNGGGLLVVTGKLSGSGSNSWNGLIFVIGKGEVDFSGMNVAMTGGLYVVNVQPDTNGVPQFGTTKFSMSGNSQFLVNANTSKMLTAIIPPKQTSYREITSLRDAS